MEWPIYKKELLITGDIDSSVAICTLWTQRRLIASAITSDMFSVVGNLYSSTRGLDFLIRNLLANPKIYYLVVCGTDGSGSGQGLIDFFNNGIQKEKNEQGKEYWMIKGITKGEIDIEIPEEALVKLRENVKVFDLRNISNPEKIIDFVRQNNLQAKLSPWAEPRIFPKKEVKTTVFPSENEARVIRGKTIAECWLRILKEVTTFGVVSKTQYGNEQKELLDLVAVVSGQDLESIVLPPWFTFNKTELKEYLPKILTGTGFTGVNYTYGQRMRSYFNIDQVQELINKLKQDPGTRSAIINLWDSRKDLYSKSPPCVNHVRARLRNGKLFLTVLIRSNDMFDAWPQNAFGFLYLQKLIVDGVGNCEMGDLTTISGSAHIYDDSWQAAQDLVKSHWHETVTCHRACRDERGNFVIYLENDKIIVEHCSIDGQVLQVFKGDNVSKLMVDISPFVSVIEHAVYLGTELQKAKIALDFGFLYKQDKKLIKIKNMHKKKRLPWDEYFMQIADTVAERATCDRGKSGSLIVRDKRIIATGYVGSPPGQPHCDDVGHMMHEVIDKDGNRSMHCIRTLHAEENAILQAAEYGIAVKGATIYCKMTPCFYCAKRIARVGIKRVVARKRYHSEALSVKLLKEAGIELKILEDEVEKYGNQ